MTKLKFGGTLGKISNDIKEGFQEVGEKAQATFENTVDDIKATLDNFGDCAKAIDQIRLRVMHRQIEYHTELTRILIKSHIISREIFEEVWKIVDRDIRRDPDPSIYRLTFPYNDAEKINIDSFVFPSDRKPCMLVHGKGYQPTKGSALSFFSQIDEVLSFAQGDPTRDIYLVSYDTDMTDKDERVIKRALEHLFGMDPSGDGTPVLLAIFWRELERRAKKTAEDYILPFLRKMHKFIRDSEQEDHKNIGFVLTHSLGCFTFAYAAQNLMGKIDGTNYYVFDNWLCMAPAIPASGFTGTGDFNMAPLIGMSNSTSVWYSRMDWVLNVAYSLATGHLAMGVSGPLESKYDVTPMDVTMIVREDHHVNYFKLLKTEIIDTLNE